MDSTEASLLTLPWLFHLLSPERKLFHTPKHPPPMYTRMVRSISRLGRPRLSRLTSFVCFMVWWLCVPLRVRSMKVVERICSALYDADKSFSPPGCLLCELRFYVSYSTSLLPSHTEARLLWLTSLCHSPQRKLRFTVCDASVKMMLYSPLLHSSNVTSHDKLTLTENIAHKRKIVLLSAITGTLCLTPTSVLQPRRNTL